MAEYRVHGEPWHPPKPRPRKVQETTAPDEYGIAPAWIDAAGRTRTWALCNPHGTKMAEINTKEAALKLARLLNHVMSNERGHNT